MVDVDALIAEARETFDRVNPVDQEILLGKKVVTARFWPIAGNEWRDLTAKHPYREGSQFDMAVGYDLDSVVRAYPRVYLVEGEDITNVATKWSEICSVLSGPDLKNVALAVWGLNEYDPAQRMAAAGKALKGGRRKKRSSPANSASQSAN